MGALFATSAEERQANFNMKYFFPMYTVYQFTQFTFDILSFVLLPKKSIPYIFKLDSKSEIYSQKQKSATVDMRVLKKPKNFFAKD